MVALTIALVLCLSGIILLARWVVFTSRSAKTSPSSRRDARYQHELVEAIATFTEQVRDAMSGASGLEQALASAADTCPTAIRSEVRQLVADLRYGSTEECLRDFADRLGHPTSDYVVAALLTAVQNETRDMTGLLGHLSVTAREECRLHLRIWVSRARLRSSTRMVTGAVAVFASGLVLLNPGYVAAYATPGGAAILLVEVLGFSSGLILMRRMSLMNMPARLLGHER
jgi:Flp pilus assembly protein TadB